VRNKARTERRAFITLAWDQIGRTGTVADVWAALVGVLPAELLAGLAEPGGKREIADFLHEADDDGLPYAPAIDTHGTHVQGELLSVEEFRYVVRTLGQGMRALDARRRQWVKRCLDVHGVDISDELGDTGTDGS
jgi:hypothetical protein